YRVPRGLSVVSPPSSCPGCSSRIAPWDNVPVLSWLLLRGRCRTCRMRIPVRYPLVEAGTAAAFAVVALRFVPGVLDWTVAGTLALAAFLYLAAITVALALIDLDVRRLPNAIVLPAYAVGAALLVPAALLMAEPGRLLSAGIGAVALAAFYLLLAVARPGGMGMGDVKLAGVLGLFLGFQGWGALVVGAFGAFVLGGVFSLGLVLARRAGRASRIPFGPWMLAGAWVGIAAGEAIAAGYLSFIGLGD
ncbi:MAG TPA: prepilin peptidase, partial [Rhodoglobus sp.]|nr:prepilin peptidase [Rhodoglobus sp.]